MSAENLAGWRFRKKLSLLTWRAHTNSDGISSRRRVKGPYRPMDEEQRDLGCGVEWTGLNWLTGKVHVVLTGAARGVWWVDLTGRWMVEQILKCQPQELGGVWWEFNTRCIIHVSLVGRRTEKARFARPGGSRSIRWEFNTRGIGWVSLAGRRKRNIFAPPGMLLQHLTGSSIPRTV